MRHLLNFLVFTFCVFSAAANPLWESRIKAFEQVGLPYFYNADVQAKIDALLLNQQQKTSIIAGKQAVFQPYIDHACQLYGLPWFIRFLPAANTGLDPRFTATDGSTGIWPLNFSVGKKYGLTQTSILDQRRAVTASADAACHYLKDLHHIYKDWLKTITAFRIGGVRLNQAIRLSGNSLKFEEIYKQLNREEQQYIAGFYAMLVVMYHFEETGMEKQPYVTVKTDTATAHCLLPIALFEDKTGITKDELLSLNPEFKSNVIPWFGVASSFHIPASKKASYLKVRDSLCMYLTMKDKPVVVYDTIITKRDSVTYIELKPRSERVIEPSPGNAGTPPRAVIPAKVWVVYKVKPGDGFYTLSDIFDCTITEMKLWNGIRSNSLIAGNVLRFYVPYNKKGFYEQINGMDANQKRNIANSDN